MDRQGHREAEVEPEAEAGTAPGPRPGAAHSAQLVLELAALRGGAAARAGVLPRRRIAPIANLHACRLHARRRLHLIPLCLPPTGRGEEHACAGRASSGNAMWKGKEH